MMRRNRLSRGRKQIGDNPRGSVVRSSKRNSPYFRENNEEEEQKKKQTMPPKKRNKTTKTTNKRSAAATAASTAPAGPVASAAAAVTVVVKAEDKANLEKMKKAKGKNFTKEEDAMLAKAYVAVTDDPINGCHQGGEHFWKKVLEMYEMLWDGEPIVERDFETLKTRFSKRMLGPLQKFNAIFISIKNKDVSGTNEDDWIREAHKVYKAKEDGKNFTHVDVWRIVRNALPKFSENETTNTFAAVGVNGTPFNSIGSGQGVRIPKPQGSKQAKSAKKTQDTMSYINNKVDSHMADLISVTANIASSLSYGETLNGYKAYVDMANSFYAQGNQEKCNEMMKKAEEQIALAQKNRPPPPPVIPTPSSSNSSTNNSSIASGDETNGLNLLGAVSNIATPLANNGNITVRQKEHRPPFSHVTDLLQSDDEDDGLFRKNLGSKDDKEPANPDAEMTESQSEEPACVSQGLESPTHTQVMNEHKAIYESTTAAFTKEIQDADTQVDTFEMENYRLEVQKEMERIKEKEMQKIKDSVGLEEKKGIEVDSDGDDLYENEKTMDV